MYRGCGINSCNVQVVFMIDFFFWTVLCLDKSRFDLSRSRKLKNSFYELCVFKYINIALF